MEHLLPVAAEVTGAPHGPPLEKMVGQLGLMVSSLGSFGMLHAPDWQFILSPSSEVSVQKVRTRMTYDIDFFAFRPRAKCRAPAGAEITDFKLAQNSHDN